ncbi:uncharacterized protein KD926_002086 [Aspergillus affinis]|uniref:uncharacterized protein n=1 Tax=Aspergillus affinis TaxID=1070780 RepID=UPI0022FE79B2|nr:uncharacterized protein KD926_002086 [Aspergillus affinis]KAI9036322.1 hypothetical protein KD926_002086 [Aspergillus affinis]
MRKSLLTVGGLLASSVSGHIQMSNPYPIRSPLNKDTSGQKDYSYTNPLSTDGSDYPCKGYAKDPFESQATYSPGGSYTMELQGSATHGGGSCQIALSYDSGDSWKVIHTILGGCPIAKKYDFTIPSDAQTGEALLGWSWFNKIGNREMYMNCAQVTIAGGDNRKISTALARRESFGSLPELFRANTGGPAGCKTIEGEEVNFPLPGPSVKGSLSGMGYECTGSAPFLRGDYGSKASSNTVSLAVIPKASSSAMAPSFSAVAATASIDAAQSSAVANPASNKVASTFRAPEAHAQQTTAAEPPSDTEVSCAHGSIVCGADGKSWSLYDNGRAAHMGNVVAGTQCLHGAMQRVA